MRLNLFFFLLSVTAFGQTFPGIDKTILTNAILPECFNKSFPKECSQKKLEEIITSVITDDLINDLPESNKKSFSLSCLFFTGKDGKVIPEYTEVRCESNTLKEAITAYINTKLPEFLPKNIKYPEQRSSHIINLTFIRNPKTKGYFIANDSEIKNKKIKTNYIIHDKAPVFPGCDEIADFNDQIECTKNKIFNLIKKNYHKPGKESLYVNMSIQVIVDSNGKVNVEFIMGSAPDEYEYEVYRAVNTLPILKPASIRNIPAPISFNVGSIIFR